MQYSDLGCYPAMSQDVCHVTCVLSMDRETAKRQKLGPAPSAASAAPATSAVTTAATTATAATSASTDYSQVSSTTDGSAYSQAAYGYNYNYQVARLFLSGHSKTPLYFWHIVMFD